MSKRKSKGWSRHHYSFQKCFDNADIYQMFSAYLEESKNLELLRFYELTRAKSLVENFLKKDALEEINIDSAASIETLKRYEKAVLGETLFDSSIFEPCLKIVTHDLQHDVFRRFKFEKPFKDFMETKKKEMELKEFEHAFTSKIHEIEETVEGEHRELEEDSADESDDLTETFTSSTEEVDLFKLLTVRISFSQEDIDDAFKDTGLSINSYVMNKMIMDIMKPFVGAKSVDLEHTGSKKIGISFLLKGSKNLSDEILKMKKISKENAVNWLKSYFKLKEDKESAKKVFELLVKYSVFEPLAEIEGYNTTDIFKFTIKKQCVVIGCGAAGITVANLLKNEMEVIVIDKKSELTFINGFYHLISNPSKIEELEFPVDSMVKGCKIIQSAVQKISPSVVYLEHDIIPYDYLVIASGSHYYVPYEVNAKPFLPKYPGDKFDDIKDELFDKSKIQIVIPYKKNSVISNFQNIRKAKKIIIVGSGSVACETAGELAAKYPNMKIVIITQDSRVLKKYVDKKITKATMKIFKQYGNIEVIPKKAITRVVGKRVYYKSVTNDVTTKKVEESMEADILFNAIGLRPNTKMFKQYMGDSLNARGAVQVNDYFQVQYGKFNRGETENNCKDENEELDYDSDDDLLTNDEVSDSSQVNKILEAMSIDTFTLNTNFDSDVIEQGYENIYAVGDIVDTKEEKLTFFASQHGQRAAQNILISEQCSDVEEFKRRAIRYKGGGTIIQCISLGSKGVVIKGHKFITHGSVAKYKVEFIGKQLANIVKIHESDK
eukprot:gene12354-6022_t